MIEQPSPSPDLTRAMVTFTPSAPQSSSRHAREPHGSKSRRHVPCCCLQSQELTRPEGRTGANATKAGRSSTQRRRHLYLKGSHKTISYKHRWPAVCSAIARISNPTARTSFGSDCITGNTNASRRKPVLPNDKKKKKKRKAPCKKALLELPKCPQEGLVRKVNSPFTVHSLPSENTYYAVRKDVISHEMNNNNEDFCHRSCLVSCLLLTGVFPLSSLLISPVKCSSVTFLLGVYSDTLTTQHTDSLTSVSYSTAHLSNDDRKYPGSKVF